MLKYDLLVIESKVNTCHLIDRLKLDESVLKIFGLGDHTITIRISISVM